jgi:hypothetical protein
MSNDKVSVLRLTKLNLQLLELQNLFGFGTRLRWQPGTYRLDLSPGQRRNLA